MKNKKKLILETMKEIYTSYQKECNNKNATRFYMSDLEADEYVLKVLLDIYTYDDKKEEEHRYIYQDSDLVISVVDMLVRGVIK